MCWNDFARWGQTVILSDGDVVFQPRKVERSGIFEAVEGHVLIYIHKEKALDDVERRYPAEHYVLVDDKLRILTAVNRVADRRDARADGSSCRRRTRRSAGSAWHRVLAVSAQGLTVRVGVGLSPFERTTSARHGSGADRDARGGRLRLDLDERDGDPAGRRSVPVLAAIAARTEKLKLGTSVLIAPPRAAGDARKGARDRRHPLGRAAPARVRPRARRPAEVNALGS